MVFRLNNVVPANIGNCIYFNNEQTPNHIVNKTRPGMTRCETIKTKTSKAKSTKEQ